MKNDAHLGSDEYQRQITDVPKPAHFVRQPLYALETLYRAHVEHEHDGIDPLAELHIQTLLSFISNEQQVTLSFDYYFFFESTAWNQNNKKVLTIMGTN